MSGRRPFTQAEIDRLAADYRQYVEAGRLGVLAEEMGRSRCVLAERAKRMGLTDAQAARVQAARSAGDARRGKPMKGPHPKGFSGKTHSPAARAKMAQASLTFWEGASDEFRQSKSDLLTKVVADRGVNHRPQASWKAGWREIGGKRNYYRSRWEANYARYLEWLKGKGEIADWQHEPETFWFEAIRRGVRSYLPDFRVWEASGSSKLHEVKGWMDSRSKTTLRRMAKYHPQETIILIRERDYNAIARAVGPMIEGWESSTRKGRL